MNKIELDKLDDILYNMNILERYDEYNVDSCPENAVDSVIMDIIKKLPEWITLQTIIEGNEYWEDVTIWEYIVEDFETNVLAIEWDGKYISYIK